MIDIPENGNKIWRTVALALVTLVTGFAGSQLLNIGSAHDSGWTQQQKVDFLVMKDQLIHGQAEIIASVKEILNKLDILLGYFLQN